MESVGQNATLFPKSQISANFIFAQLLYFQQIKKMVSIVSKVSKVTFCPEKLARITIWISFI
jgi:hypothetical protein